MYYKDKTNGLHFLSESDIAVGGERLLPNDAIAITDEEAESILTMAQTLIQNTDVVSIQPTLEDILSAINSVGGPIKAALDEKISSKLKG